MRNKLDIFERFIKDGEFKYELGDKTIYVKGEKFTFNNRADFETAKMLCVKYGGDY